MAGDLHDGQPDLDRLTPGTTPIADHALIGDTHTTALVTRAGSVDWLCWGRHDAPALFCRLLDLPRGGFADLQLGGEAVARRYLPGTNVLETTFETPTGRAVLLDFMALHPAGARSEGPDGDTGHRLVRILRCEHGTVRGAFRARFTPNYGRERACVEARDRSARVTCRAWTLEARAGGAVSETDDGLEAAVSLREGESTFFVLQEADAETGVRELADAERDLELTSRYWTEWSAGIDYDGPWRDAVHRSALVLKLLTYAPTGAIVAAPTTSLPEAVPGERNYDYRYSWIRDASFTVTAFCNLGLAREAQEYVRFLCEVDPSGGRELRLLYGIDGSTAEEEILEHLPGWGGVGPVRIGNAAQGQDQHDIYGELLVALHAYLDATGYDPPQDLRERIATMVKNLARHCVDHQDDPDEGIWELRDGQQHLQHTKALLWVGLDRAWRTAEHLEGFDPAEIARWRETADALRAEYEEKAWNDEVEAHTQAYGSTLMDASVLRTMLFGALDPASARARSTLAAVERELTVNDLVYRYRTEDGLEGDEATFTACSFWRGGVYALAGDTAEAQRIYEKLIGFGNDLHLFAEELSPDGGVHLGNFPQAFTHMCVINHAVRYRECVTNFGVARSPE